MDEVKQLKTIGEDDGSTTVEMTGAQLADLIEAYLDRIDNAPDEPWRYHYKESLKALMFDMANGIVTALRLTDANAELEDDDEDGYVDSVAP